LGVNAVKFSQRTPVRGAAALTMSYANCSLLASYCQRIAYTDDNLNIIS